VRNNRALATGWCCLVLAALLSPVCLAATNVIRYFPVGAIYDYRWRLLALALAHTRDGVGETQLQAYSNAGMTQSRSIEALQHGDVDVLAFGSNPEREAKMCPIRVDILRGILGYRLLLIRADQQERIRHLNAEIFRQQVTLGFNSQWADLAILQSNGYQVVTSVRYNSLFAMLAAGRFDAFPRGVTEIGRELALYHAQYPDLVEEQSLALFMDYPVYFWVRKDRAALAVRIERGLNLALADGSFKALFQREYSAEITQLRHDRRRVIRLDNPLLPANFVPSDTSWWWPLRASDLARGPNAPGVETGGKSRRP